MSGVVLPDWVARNQRIRATLDNRSSGVAQTRYWNPLLRDIDPRLELVFVANADAQAQAAGVVPFRWHIRRTNEAGPDTYWPLLAADGSFREMAEDWLHQLRRGDLWNPQVRHDISTATRRADASKERAKETRREARVDELAQNIKAMDNPGTLFSDVPWASRPAGNRARKQG